jgi:hypothetical protein
LAQPLDAQRPVVGSNAEHWSQFVVYNKNAARDNPCDVLLFLGVELLLIGNPSHLSFVTQLK